MNDEISLIGELALCEGMCPYEDCKCAYLEQAAELMQRLQLPAYMIHLFNTLKEEGVKFEFSRYKEKFQLTIIHNGTNLPEGKFSLIIEWCYKNWVPLTVKRVV